MSRSPTGARRLSPLAIAALFATGCAEELGPVERPTASIQGRVRIGNEPLPGGWIELVPIQGTAGDLRSAPLRTDGTFEARGVAVGQVAIRLVNPPAPLPAPSTDPRLGFDQFASPIRRTIRDSEPIDIDLLAEAREYRARSTGQ